MHKVLKTRCKTVIKWYGGIGEMKGPTTKWQEGLNESIGTASRVGAWGSPGESRRGEDWLSGWASMWCMVGKGEGFRCVRSHVWCVYRESGFDRSYTLLNRLYIIYTYLAVINLCSHDYYFRFKIVVILNVRF